jgi:hypothetical protein
LVAKINSRLLPGDDLIYMFDIWFNFGRNSGEMISLLHIWVLAKTIILIWTLWY